jgi:ubiquinone biosynthesis protein Coq4
MAEFKKLPGSAVGGDVEELRAFANHLTTKSLTDMQLVLQQIDHKIAQTTWSGPDANKFAMEWNQLCASTITNVRNLLTGISQRAMAQAAQQEKTSAV